MILITEHEVKDPQGDEILNLFAKANGYTSGGKQEFLQSKILDFIMNSALTQAVAEASNVAADNKKLDFEAEIKPELEITKKP